MDVADLHIDLSRNFISSELVEALVHDFGSRVTRLRDSMLAGAAINTTENRKVLHVALRDSLLGSAESVEANAVLNQMAGFAEAVRKIASVLSSTRAPVICAFSNPVIVTLPNQDSKKPVG